MSPIKNQKMNNKEDALELWRVMQGFGKAIAEAVKNGSIDSAFADALLGAKTREAFMNELTYHFVEVAKKKPVIIEAVRAITALPSVSEPGNEYTFSYALALARLHYASVL